MKKNIYVLFLITAILFLPQTSYALELLTNGSFETGSYTGWTTLNTQTTTYCTNFRITTAGGTTCNQATSAPQDGAFVSINGFDGRGGEMSVYQDVTVPLFMSIQLTFQFRAQWNIPSAANQARLFNVQVRDTSNNVLQTVYTFTASSGTSNQSSGWRTEVHNLSAYSGQTIRLYFQQVIPQPFTGPGQFELDGVKLEAFGPTAAGAVAAGRVRTENGYGIKGAIVTFVDNDGETRSTRSNQFGHFRFTDVEVGNTYVFQVRHRRHQFVNGTQIINLQSARKDINFTAESLYKNDASEIISKSIRE